MALFLLGTVGVFTLLVFITIAKRDRADFEERFPPLSDAEFLDRCKPGSDPVVALKVRLIVAKHLAVEYERVHPSASFVDDLGAD